MLSVIQRILLFAIRAYRHTLSPFLPSRCRFAPSCSEYASEAIERHGVVRGAFISAMRLLKCHPFHPGGHDPVR
jgi:putative membrane protein insertion efficiency factor